MGSLSSLVFILGGGGAWEMMGCSLCMASWWIN